MVKQKLLCLTSIKKVQLNAQVEVTMLGIHQKAIIWPGSLVCLACTKKVQISSMHLHSICCLFIHCKVSNCSVGGHSGQARP